MLKGTPWRDLLMDGKSFSLPDQIGSVLPDQIGSVEEFEPNVMDFRDLNLAGWYVKILRKSDWLCCKKQALLHFILVQSRLTIY